MSASPKSTARKVALQALYQWQMTGDRLVDIQHQMEKNPELGKFHKSYFEVIFFGVVEKLEEVDVLVSKYTDRGMEKIDPIEKCVLRIGTYELMFKPEVPFRVVINESVNLAKLFGSEKSHAYINSVLDKVSQEVRQLEISVKRKKTS